MSIKTNVSSFTICTQRYNLYREERKQFHFFSWFGIFQIVDFSAPTTMIKNVLLINMMPSTSHIEVIVLKMLTDTWFLRGSDSGCLWIHLIGSSVVATDGWDSSHTFSLPQKEQLLLAESLFSYSGNIFRDQNLDQVGFTIEDVVTISQCL